MKRNFWIVAQQGRDCPWAEGYVINRLHPQVHIKPSSKRSAFISKSLKILVVSDFTQIHVQDMLLNWKESTSERRAQKERARTNWIRIINMKRQSSHNRFYYSKRQRAFLRRLDEKLVPKCCNIELPDRGEKCRLDWFRIKGCQIDHYAQTNS